VIGAFLDPLIATLRDAIGDRATISEALLRFLESEPVTERTDDDTTLVLATRLAGQAASGPGG
jgi:hypothetical protein